MTLFRDLDPDQKEALKEVVFRGIDRRIREEIEYTNQVIRFLVLGNAAGIVLLAGFMGGVASKDGALIELVSPLWKFFFGCVFAALIYAAHMTVSAQATNHIVKQAVAFFRSEIEIDSMRGYGFSKTGLWIVRLLALTSMIFFTLGVYQCIQILKTL